jgi:DNA integrity scanning protein DisA with diadenylate cyclase activity
VQVKNEREFLLIMTMQQLITLYEQEGYLYEALQVAEIAAQFNQQLPALERIKSRIANLEAEEAS